MNSGKCCDATIGTMRERLRIEQRDTTKDSYGEQDATWTTYATLWAAVESLRPSERLQMDVVSGRADYKVTVRKNSTTAAIASSMRCVWTTEGNRVLHVASAPIVLSKLYIQFLASEHAA